MTEQTQPTDAEILDAADDFRSQYKHGGTTFDEFAALDFARAVLAKWGTPATGGEPAGTVGYTVHGTQYVNWRTKPPAHGTPLYTTPQPTQTQAGEYPALVCDYCGALTPDPWHSSGMLHGKMSKHIHSCDACAARGAAQPVGRVPLTHAQAKALVSRYVNDPLHLVYQVEAAHGIKQGGQHGTE